MKVVLFLHGNNQNRFGLDFLKRSETAKGTTDLILVMIDDLIPNQ